MRRSRLRNLFEFLISPVIIPWRCSICDRREYKFRFIDMTPPKRDEDDEEDVEFTGPRVKARSRTKASSAAKPESGEEAPAPAAEETPATPAVSETEKAETTAP